MQTITLKVEDSVSDKFLWFLNHFSKNEIEIIDKTVYQSDDEYLRSIKNMEESILDASKEKLDKYVPLDKLDW